MKGYDWVKKVKEKTGVSSDNGIAQLIGTTRANICDHKKGRATTFDEAICFRIAAVLDIDPAEVVLDQKMEAAKNSEQMAFWERMAKIAGSAAAAVLGAATLLPQIAKTAELYILC